MGVKVCFLQQTQILSFGFDFLIPSGKDNESEKSLQK